MTAIYTSIIIGLILIYLLSISLYIYYWKKLPRWHLAPDFCPQTSIAVLVAARNEESNIAACIQAVLAQNYPANLLEIIVIDDHSEDNTAAIVQQYKVKYLRLDRSKTGKKNALEQGIKLAQSQLIATTDADCVMADNWLLYLASIYEDKPTKLIAAPVCFYDEKNTFERFQSLDFMGMMAVAGAGIEGRFMNMCNGANLAYERAAFYAVNGFEGIQHLASGDDMLLMEKIAARYPLQIAYLKNPAAQTRTKAKKTVASFVQQRIRWASKSGNYQSPITSIMLANVWLLCWSILISLLLGCFLNSYFLYLFALSFLLKGIADFLFLGMMSRFFERPQLMTAFVPALFWHCWYIIVVGTASIFIKKYDWKGRNVR